MSAPTLTIAEWRAMHTPDVIGSGSAASTIGEGYESPLAEWAYRRGLIDREDVGEIDAVWLGLRMERTVLDFHARKSGLAYYSRDGEPDRERIESIVTASGDCEVLGWVEGRQPYIRSRRYPWMVATLDGIGEREDGHARTVEVKYPGLRQLRAWHDDGSAPDAYRIQVQHTLIVVGCVPAGDLAALIGHDYRCVDVTLADTNVDAIVTLERHFLDSVRTGAEPRIDARPSSLAAFKALHPHDNGATKILPTEACEIHSRITQIDAALAESKAAEKERDALKARLQQLIGDATFGELPDGAGTYSLKTTDRKAYEVAATSYRALRFSKAKSQ